MTPAGFSDFLVSLDRSLVSRYAETEAGSYHLFLLTYGPVSFFFFSPIFFALPACKRSGGEGKKRPLHPTPSPKKARATHHLKQLRDILYIKPKYTQKKKQEKRRKKRRLKQKMYTRLRHVKETEREEKQETGVAVRCCTYQGGYCENLH